MSSLNDQLSSVVMSTSAMQGEVGAASILTALDKSAVVRQSISMSARAKRVIPVRIWVENTSDGEVRLSLLRDSVLSHENTTFILDDSYHLVLAPFERCSMVIHVKYDKA